MCYLQEKIDLLKLLFDDKERRDIVENIKHELDDMEWQVDSWKFEASRIHSALKDLMKDNKLLTEEGCKWIEELLSEADFHVKQYIDSISD